MKRCGYRLNKSLQTVEKKRRKREKQIFLSICSKEDADMIKGKADLPLREFERICCLLEALGLLSLLACFELRHMDLVKELSEEIEMELESNDTGLMETQRQQYDRWVKDFCEELPTVPLKSFFGHIVEM